MVDWSPPKVSVAYVQVTGDQTLIGLALPAGLSEPLAPASLWIDGSQVMDLDAVVDPDESVTVFRSQDKPSATLAGTVVDFQQWWTPDALAAVTDLDREWTLTPAPTPGHHEHCLLDWTTIEQGAEVVSAWRSGDDWICPSCYERYIVNDRLGVRA